MAELETVAKEYDFDINPIDGFDMQLAQPYGIGIDTHSKFIYVTVIVSIDGKYKRFERTFDTTWTDLNNGKNWALAVLRQKPIPPLSEVQLYPIHYTIESTGTYHYPVLRAWQGNPSVVNPLLASPARRKTDQLDSKLLAYQNLTGLWPVSFIVNDEINTLRLLIAQRNTMRDIAKKTSNQINNYILRYGMTQGREGSVTKSSAVRKLVEAKIGLLNNTVQTNEFAQDKNELFCPDALNDQTATLLANLYERYDDAKKQQHDYELQAIHYAKSINFMVGDGEITDGMTLMKNLCSVPGIAEVTAILWLANIVTPLRFPNAKACSAFCGLDPSLKISAGKVTSAVKRGGNKDLHQGLSQCASVLLRSHTEPFGIWGYKMYQNGGKWKKACAAVARKISVAMYWVNLKNEPFSYDGYKINEFICALKCTLDELRIIEPQISRYVKILKKENIFDTEKLFEAYNKCHLKKVAGLGDKFFQLIRSIMAQQKKYVSLLKDAREKGEII